MAIRKDLIAGSAIALVVLVAGGVYLSRASSENIYADCLPTTVSGGMDRFGGSFTLSNQNGERVTDQDVFTKPSLLYFGYTYCPDVCPLDSARNADAAEILKERGLDAQTVFITVDPDRDTVDVVKDFTEIFPGDMVGLTGTTEEITAVSKSWRNFFELKNEEDKEDYLVDHLTNTYLVMPGTETVEFFDRNKTPEEVAESAACFIEAAS